LGVGTFDATIVSLVFFLNIYFGLRVYLSKFSSLRHFSFLGLALSIAFWLVFAYLSELFPSDFPFMSLIFSRLAIIFGFVFAFFILLFSESFRFATLSNFSKVLTLVLVILIIITLFTPLVVKDITLKEISFNINYGPFYYLLLLPLGLIMVFMALVNFIKSFRLLKKEEKKEIYAFFIGLLTIIVLSLISGIVLPKITGLDIYYKFGNYSTIILTGITANAILKGRFFDLRMLATEVMAVIVVLALFIDIFYSRTLVEILFKLGIFILASYGSYRLVYSVNKEIQRAKEIRKLSEELQRSNERLREMDRLKTEFLSAASHELNSPIAIIKGYLHMLLYEGFGKVDKKAKEYLKRTYHHAEILSKIVAELLNVSRIEQGRLQIEVTSIDVLPIIKEVGREYAEEARRKGLKLILHLPPSLPKVRTNADKFQEILVNLLSNAVKYTKAGEIDLGVREDRERLIFWVRDTGIGIPLEKQKFIGEKFYRVESSLITSISGSGLGLYLVKKYLSLMDGKFWFESPGLNKGSTFYFSLKKA